MVRILPWARFFCNVHLFRVPHSWTGSIQMKSGMTFIRGNRCIEREKDNFKSREVKHLREFAQAVSIKNCIKPTSHDSKAKFIHIYPPKHHMLKGEFMRPVLKCKIYLPGKYNTYRDSMPACPSVRHILLFWELYIGD